MSRLLLTHAADGQEPLLDLVEPHLRHYAEANGYEFEGVRGRVDVGDRTQHWAKIQLLRERLARYEQVLWIDNDIILRTTTDVATGLQPGDMHALVMEQTPHGVGPNTGLWLLRGSEAGRAFIDRVWATGQLPDATLHDQATVAHLLGFSYLPRYTRPLHPSPWLAMTSWLAPQWNMLVVHHPEAPLVARGVHWGGMRVADKLPLMRQQLIQDRSPGWTTLLPPEVVATMAADPALPR